MRDPIEELESFSVPGSPMTPLPAAEVRKRGDRIRRRNNVLTGAAAVAVVAVLATPFAVLAGNDRSDDAPAPATHSPSPTVTWVQEIPAGFSLTEGLPRATVQDGYQAQADADACPGLGWSPDGPPAAVDVEQVVQTENEGGVDRALALYADEESATRARLGLEARVQQCAAATDGKARYTEDVASDATSLVYVDHVSEVGEMFAHQVVQVGNALLLDTVYSLGGGDPTIVQRTADLIKEKSAPVVAAMQATFSESSATSPTTPGTGEGAVSAIPPDLDLGRGLSSSEGNPVEGPSATAEGVPAIELCGTSVWPVTGVERLAITVRGAEYGENRELVTFASSADLTAALDALRASADASCTPDGRTMASYDKSVGDDTVTFAMGSVGGTGLDIYQFVQVGRSLLATHRYTEGLLDGAGPAVRDVTLANQGLVPDLCVFTEGGC